MMAYSNFYENFKYYIHMIISLSAIHYYFDFVTAIITVIKYFLIIIAMMLYFQNFDYYFIMNIYLLCFLHFRMNWYFPFKFMVQVYF